MSVYVYNVYTIYTHTHRHTQNSLETTNLEYGILGKDFL